MVLITLGLFAVAATAAPPTPPSAVGGSAVGLSLLESSGAANGTIAAAGHFCGEPAVVLLDATTGTLSVMHGPTPFLVARLHYSGGWDDSEVLAAAAVGNSTLAVLHSSGLVQWATIEPEGCSSLHVAHVHIVEDGASALAAAGDGAVLVARTPKPSSPSFALLSPHHTPIETDFGLSCTGRWAALATHHNSLFTVCNPDPAKPQSLELTHLVRPHGGAWATNTSEGAAVKINGTRSWTLPKTSPLLGVELMDVYGDQGVTAAVVSADTTVTLFDVWSGDATLPILGPAAEDESAASRQLDPGRTWSSIASSRFIMASYYMNASDGTPPTVGHDTQLFGLRVPDASRSGFENEFVVDLLLFGQSVHLERRQSSLRDWKGQRQFSLMEHNMTLPLDRDQVRQWMTDTNVDSFSFSVCDRASGSDNSSTAFVQFVRFLHLTTDFAVNGRQLRVALVLDPPTEATEGSGCGPPGDSPLTAWNDTALFDGTHYYNQTGYATWGELVGRLAVQYPHLVSLDIDDMSHDISPPFLTFTADVVANITANMRRHSPYLTLAPTIYYSQTIPSFERWPDLPLALDSPIFFFRNQRQGAGPCAPPECSQWWGPKAKRLPNGTVDCPTCGCLAWTCAEPTVYNAPGEAAVMAAALPEGRDMLVGFYATGHSSLGEPSPRYVQELLPIVWGLPRVVGTSIWTMHVPAGGAESCRPGKDRLFGGDKGCIIRHFYGSVGL